LAQVQIPLNLMMHQIALPETLLLRRMSYSQISRTRPVDVQERMFLHDYVKNTASKDT
jgi:hypothetical protein